MTVPLADVRDESLFGGKATQLGASLRAGLPVPPGFALSVSAVAAIVAGDSAALDQAFAQVEKLGVVAVRSSAVGEDGAAASFAGQHATVLDVRDRQALHDAIGEVAASAKSASALGYRDKLGLAEEARMAIVVQQLVPSEKAGVMFTRNPMTGDDERVIEASWGLGEVVVAGLVTPDLYRLTRNGSMLGQTAGEKDIAIRSLAAGGTAEFAVEGDLVSAFCLNAQELTALNALALQCEAHHGPGPHDIEFAFAAGKLFLLQCRAITRHATR
jgi:pyruvate,water dikinase